MSRFTAPSSVEFPIPTGSHPCHCAARACPPLSSRSSLWILQRRELKGGGHLAALQRVAQPKQSTSTHPLPLPSSIMGQLSLDLQRRHFLKWDSFTCLLFSRNSDFLTATIKKSECRILCLTVVVNKFIIIVIIIQGW